MKKWIAIILTLCLAVGMTACAKDNSQMAFRAGSVAFDDLNQAYEAIDTFGSDLYEAWFMDINEEEEITGETRYSYDYEKGYVYFCDQLSIEKQFIDAAVNEMAGDLYSTAGENYEFLMRSTSSIFSTCVNIVSTAYDVSGKNEMVADLLVDAKDQMKQMSAEYSDYEHYPNLKGYFTLCLAYFDFCKYPEGSFDQVVQTLNNYRNDAREYFFDLNYVFNDSILGMDDLEKIQREQEDTAEDT